MDKEESATEEKAETVGGVGWDNKDVDGDIGGITGKRRSSATQGHSGQQGQQLGGHLHGSGWGGSGMPPWGKTRGKGKGCRPAGKPGQRVLKSGGQGGGLQGLQSGKTPGGTTREWEGGVELLQGIDAPGLEEFSRGGKTSGVPTEGYRVIGEEGRGWGGDRNPPTPKKLRRVEPAAATRERRADQGQRRRQAHSDVRWQTESARVPAQAA